MNKIFYNLEVYKEYYDLESANEMEANVHIVKAL